MDNISIDQVNNILKAFKIKATCVSCNKVRNITCCDVELEIGTKIKDLERFSNEIAIALKAFNKPIIKPIPSDGIVRMEFFSNKTEILELIGELSNFKNIPEVYLGNSSIDNSKITIDISKLPHLLIAGSPGSGKSVLLQNIVLNLLSKKNNKLFLIDTKEIEFGFLSNYRNVDCSTTYDRAVSILELLIQQMEWRYLQIKNNSCLDKNLPTITLIIDEFADLIAQDVDDKFYKLLCVLSQKSRAARINCIVATQRPSVDVVRGLIKANFPARISCRVASNVDSRIILNASGAELLSGNGDAIISCYKYNLVRFQTAFVSQEEIKKILNDSKQLL